MLEGLDALDWSSVSHAYGPATDVPQTLRRLVSDDESVREEALYDLFGNIWHQGTVYDATVPAIPFLFELLTAEGPQDRSGIALLLASIADGRGYFEVHASGAWGEPSLWSKVLRKRRTTLDEELRREANRVEAVCAAISKELPSLLPFLADPNEEIRQHVALALAKYPEHREASLPALNVAVRTESYDEALAAMRFAIEHLTPDAK